MRLPAAARRPGDVAARYGGEEFAVILPGTSDDEAVQTAEAIREAVAMQSVVHGRNATGIVTISIGVATAVPARDALAASLFDQADQALYAAKAKGRNRTIRFESAEGCGP